MKLTTLIENTTRIPGLTPEHGLSLFVEAAGHTFLFDTGASGAFADNAARLGVDLNKAEFAVLSHGHYDHCGGLRQFLERNDHASVYANRNCFDYCHSPIGKHLGLAPELTAGGRVIPTGDVYSIAPGLTLYTCNDRPQRADPFGMTWMVDGRMVPDDFRHEHYLLIEENGKRILLSGCSHKGIVNIVRWFQPDILVGGFHFKSLPIDDPRLRQWGESLAASGTVFYTGHCTGQAQFDALKPILGDNLHAISTGSVTVIP